MKVHEFEGAGHVTSILPAENWQKVDEFEPIYLDNTDIDEKRFVIFEHTIKHLFLVMFIYPDFNDMFLVLLLFLPELFTFKPLNAQYSNFERLWKSGRTSVRLKSGKPRQESPSNRSFNILNF